MASQWRGRVVVMKESDRNGEGSKGMIDEFDWVAARNNCTAASVFQQLLAAVCLDRKKRLEQNAILEQTLVFNICNENKFFIRKIGSHTVVFERSGETIKVDRVHIAGEERPILRLSVHMNDKGECALFRDNKTELLPWQVRRVALEDTFFGDR